MGRQSRKNGILSVPRALVGLIATTALWIGCSSSNGATTTSGGDAAPACTSSQTSCSTGCADTKTDNANCGACGKACAAGSACSAGACTATCGTSQKLCTDSKGSICASIQTDNANCGACGNACAIGQVCSAGECASTCSGTEVSCMGSGGSYCADTQSDNANCGACGRACTTGSCVMGTCTAGMTSCATDQTVCGADAGMAYCASTETDEANCGGCGKICSASMTCTAGACTTVAATCGGTQTLCGGEAGATCVDTSTDLGNCGSCGNACSAGDVCSMGTCSSSCTGGDGGAGTRCAPDGGRAYCANTATDNDNCGACGVACTAGKICVAGVCTAECGSVEGSPEVLCPAVGMAVAYCANEMSDSANCGGCGTVCAAGQACVMGTCSASCGNAGGVAESLCPPVGTAGAYCANEQTDGNNCGGCGKACAAGEVCSGGKCAEVCGSVGGVAETLCPAVGTAAPYCANEQTDNNDCGGCGVTCTADEVCSSGKCGSACGTSGGVVESLCPAVGTTPAYCTNAETDPNNCGACGTACARGDTCVVGNCVACQPVLLIGTNATPAAGLTSNLLNGTSEFCTVDYLNANGGTTPTAAYLERYDAVLAFNDNGVPYNDPAGLGNSLGLYFNNGGRVVVALFADGGYALAGGFVAQNFLLITPAGVGQTADTFSVANAAQAIVPSSPLFAQVAAITGTGWHGNLALQNGGVAVAKWASGDVLAVTGKITDGFGRVRNRVDLNILPDDIASGAWGGNGYQLLRNALLYQ